MQFGGFAADDERLPSRDRTIAQRTLVVRGGQVVLIGLPVVGDPAAPSDRLGGIRRRAEARGFRHKYHRPGDPLDPDAYLSVGELADGPPPDPVPTAAAIAALARPTLVRLGREDVALVEFTDPVLPRAGCRSRPL